jgi:hypothetical protein
LIASLVAGIVYWCVTFSGYLFSSISSGKLPFDALVMLIPVNIFALVVGCCFCYPVYLLLIKYSKFNKLSVLTCSISIAVVFAMVIVRQFTDVTMYVSAVASGFVGGLLFYWFKQRSDTMNQKD